MTGTIHLVLADDHALLLDGLRAVLDAEPDLEVVATAMTADGFLDAIRRHRPDVGILDLDLPGGGLACLDRVAEERLPVRVLVLTAHSDPDAIRAVWNKGAAGYALKTDRPRQTIATVRQVARGQLVFPGAAREGPRTPSARLAASLTERERAVLSALGEGLTNAEIASRLGVSGNTVKFHLQNLYLKLDVRTRTAAVAWYLREAPKPR